MQLSTATDVSAALPSRLATDDPTSGAGMSLRNRILFLAATWLVVLTPFLFWQGTWFGRPLSDQQIGNFLHDRNPRHVIHALQQVGDRMSRKDSTATMWYADLVVLASSADEEVRSTDAWVLGQDATQPQFHEALRRLLRDESPAVRNNAALALVRFDDASGHDQIVSMLDPMVIKTPRSGRILQVVRPGAAVRDNAVVAKVDFGNQISDIEAPLAGQVRSVTAQRGDSVFAGSELLVVNPAADQVLSALQALYQIGRPEDLQAVAPYLRTSPNVLQRIHQQAELTDKAIRQRATR